MTRKLLEIRLFGEARVTGLGPNGVRITGKKKVAIFAMLATSPLATCSRKYIEKTLWGHSFDEEHANNSFRKAISDIRKDLGQFYGKLIKSNGPELTLELDLIHFAGSPDDGEFLGDIYLQDPEYNRWVRHVRRNPLQIASLFHRDRLLNKNSLEPVIAVAPLQVVYGENNLPVLGDWISNEITRSMSASCLMSVINHLTMRQFDRNRLSQQDVSHILKADYCISGTIRSDGQKIAIGIDINEMNGNRLLGHFPFQCTKGDLTSIDGGVINEIVGLSSRILIDDTLHHSLEHPIADIEDHRLLMSAITLMHRPRLSDFTRARSLLEEAIKRQPYAAEPYVWMAEWHCLNVFDGWSTDPLRDFQEAKKYVSISLENYPENSLALTVDGFVQNALDRSAEANIHRYDQALSRNPNQSIAWLKKATSLAFCEEGDSAVKMADKARSLSPLDPFMSLYDQVSATAHLVNGDNELAIYFADQSLNANPRRLSALRTKILAQSRLKLIEDAKNSASLLLQYDREFNITDYLEGHPASESVTGKEMVEALLASGIPFK